MADIDPEYSGLLEDLTNNRKELDSMLDTATTFRKRIDTVIPDNIDFKKKYLMEEKMKLIVSTFGIELDIRKQKEASIKTEIELRRKLSGEESSAEELYRNAEWVAKQIEKIEGKKTPSFETVPKQNVVQLPTNRK